jgi:ADP-ribose pyrophosphatase YjhB (NUDIX family)
VKHKVIAYIVRRRGGASQLLVFEHRGIPEAGVQVPAGTVEPDEGIEAGLYREVFEEAGLRPEQLKLRGKVAEMLEPEWDQLRHAYMLEAADDLPEKWAHTVGGQGEDEGMIFEHYWIELTPGVRLAGEQERWLPLNKLDALA